MRQLGEAVRGRQGEGQASVDFRWRPGSLLLGTGPPLPGSVKVPVILPRQGKLPLQPVLEGGGGPSASPAVPRHPSLCQPREVMID